MKTTTATPKQTSNQPKYRRKLPVCSFCGCFVRNTDYTGYENDALCRKCEKERYGAEKE